jgi:hypothetical protein
VAFTSLLSQHQKTNLGMKTCPNPEPFTNITLNDQTPNPYLDVEGHEA